MVAESTGAGFLCGLFTIILLCAGVLGSTAIITKYKQPKPKTKFQKFKEFFKI